MKCLIKDCPLYGKSRGYCRKHYDYERRHNKLSFLGQGHTLEQRNRINKMVILYLRGKSYREIAKELNLPDIGGISANLKFRGVLRHNPKRELQKKVFAYLATKYRNPKWVHNFFTPYQMILNGKTARIRIIKKYKGYKKYRYRLHSKEFIKPVDLYFFVFTDIENKPIFKAKGSNIYKSMYFSNPFEFPVLKFIGFMEGGGQNA